MSRHRLLYDKQQERIKNLLPSKTHDRGITAEGSTPFPRTLSSKLTLSQRNVHKAQEIQL